MNGPNRFQQPNRSQGFLLALSMLVALAGTGPAFGDFEDASPADWLAAPMGWMIDHSPLYSDNRYFKVDRPIAEGFLTEWRYQPETETLEIRFSPLRGGCPGNSIWSMSTRVERPVALSALGRDAFAASDLERSRTLARSRTVRGEEAVTRAPTSWIYPGTPAPEVRPELQADGSWVLRRAFDGTQSIADDRLAVCHQPLR